MTTGVLLTKNFKLVTIDERDANFNRRADLESIQNILESEMFQTDMARRQLLGFISHIDRQQIDKEFKETHNPYVDVVLHSGLAATSLYDVHLKEIDGQLCLIGKVDLLDTPKGREFYTHYQNGVPMQISLFLMARPDQDAWHFTKLRGADITTSPAFHIEEVPADFSILNGSQEVPVQFSVTLEDEVQAGFAITLKDYITEKSRTPKIQFRTRYSQIKAYIKANPDQAQGNWKLCQQYLRELLVSWITMATTDKYLSANTNMILSLGLNGYLDKDSLSIARELQTTLKAIRRSILSKSIIPTNYQQKLNTQFNELFDSIMKGLASTSSKLYSALYSNESFTAQVNLNGGTPNED